MGPRDVLAMTVFAFGILMGASIVITASQGRGIDDTTAYVIGAGVAVAVAGALGVVLDLALRRKKKGDQTPETPEPPSPSHEGQGGEEGS